MPEAPENKQEQKVTVPGGTYKHYQDLLGAIELLEAADHMRLSVPEAYGDGLVAFEALARALEAEAYALLDGIARADEKESLRQFEEERKRDLEMNGLPPNYEEES